MQRAGSVCHRCTVNPGRDRHSLVTLAVVGVVLLGVVDVGRQVLKEAVRVVVPVGTDTTKLHKTARL